MYLFPKSSYGTVLVNRTSTLGSARSCNLLQRNLQSPVLIKTSDQKPSSFHFALGRCTCFFSLEPVGGRSRSRRA